MTPCRARPISSTAKFVAVAESSEPTATMPSAPSRTLRASPRSASRPSTGVETAAVNVEIVSTHCPLDSETSCACAIVGISSTPSELITAVHRPQ